MQTNDFFASCGEGILTVAHGDSPDKDTVVETGKVVATPEIGNGPDASAFDPGTSCHPAFNMHSLNEMAGKTATPF